MLASLWSAGSDQRLLQTFTAPTIRAQTNTGRNGTREDGCLSLTTPSAASGGLRPGSRSAPAEWFRPVPARLLGCEVMIEFHLSVDALGKTRFAYSPLGEVASSLRLLGEGARVPVRLVVQPGDHHRAAARRDVPVAGWTDP